MVHKKKVLSLILILGILASFSAQAASAEAAGIVDPLTPYNSVRLYRDAQAIADAYPDIVSLDTIGQSVLGKDIPLLTLGKGKRPLLWIGALHAREVVTTGYLLLIAEEYAGAYVNFSSYGNMPAEKVQWLLDEFTIYIVPMANPDGVDIVTAGGAANVHIKDSARWKSNANGVNLNRNFPFDWAAYKPTADFPSTNYLSHKGASAGSEPETKALIALCESVPFEHLVSCHCQGKVVYLRDNKNGVVPGDKRLAETIANTMGYSMMPSTVSAAAGWAGGFENWFRYQYNKPGICLEFCRFNTADRETMAKFYTSDMVNWSKSRNLLFAVMDELSSLIATPTAADIYVDGDRVTFDAYNIGGSNYFKLRDIAYVLTGTDKQFDVDWDGENNAVRLACGIPYTPVGGELAAKGNGPRTPVPSGASVVLDGVTQNVKACLIGGNNYFKLRDLGKMLDFNVTWYGEENAVVIETREGYTED